MPQRKDVSTADAVKDFQKYFKGTKSLVIEKEFLMTSPMNSRRKSQWKKKNSKISLRNEIITHWKKLVVRVPTIAEA